MTLAYLDQHGESELKQIANQVAAWEYERPVEDVTDSERQRTYISLYQSHLPTLADHDIIKYDGDSKVVTPTDDVQRLTTYLDRLISSTSTESQPQQQRFDTQKALLAVIATIGFGIITLITAGVL